MNTIWRRCRKVAAAPNNFFVATNMFETICFQTLRYFMISRFMISRRANKINFLLNDRKDEAKSTSKLPLQINNLSPSVQ